MAPRIECYSVRQFSPFVGSIQIVQTEYCRALSSDGKQWQIQASCNTNHEEWELSAENYIPRRYVLFGSWSMDLGFSGLPLDPMLDVPSLDHIKNTLIKTLQDPGLVLPFEPKDIFECWLMDRESSLPLAIVHSATHDYMIPHIQHKPWQATPQQQLQALPDSLPASAIHKLETAMNAQSDHYKWFKRTPSGDGYTLDTPSCKVDAEHFPELLFNTELLPLSLGDIALDYINWLSPRLLGLHFLSSANRQKLEKSAQYYALETSKRLAIYPQALNQQILTKIQVELKIRGH